LTNNERMSVGRHNTLSRSAAAGRTGPADALTASIDTSTIPDDLMLTSEQHATNFRQAIHEVGAERTMSMGAGARTGPSSRKLELAKQLEEAPLEV